MFAMRPDLYRTNSVVRGVGNTTAQHNNFEVVEIIPPAPMHHHNIITTGGNAVSPLNAFVIGEAVPNKTEMLELIDISILP